MTRPRLSLKSHDYQREHVGGLLTSCPFTITPVISRGSILSITMIILLCEQYTVDIIKVTHVD